MRALASCPAGRTRPSAAQAYAYGSWTIEFGTIDGTSSGTFGLTGSDTGTTSSSAVYAGTLAAATAYQDLGTSNNTVPVTFTYEGPEGGGGAAVGLRWDDSSQEGDFAYVNTGSTPPVIVLSELTAGWAAGTSANSIPLALTAASSYTLTLVDDGTTITASLTDDLGVVKSCSITPTVSTANTEMMFGWVGATTSFAFAAEITAVNGSANPTVATPTLWPAAGTYSFTQSVFITTTTAGAHRSITRRTARRRRHRARSTPARSPCPARKR